MSDTGLAAQHDGEPGNGRRPVIDLVVDYNFILIFFAVFAAASILSDDFLTSGNISNLFQQAAVLGVVSVGMTFVILTANIDLAVGSVAAFSGMLVAVFMTNGISPGLAIALTLLIGMSAGLLMGGITAFADVPSFIVTLSGLVAFRGGTFLLTDGVPVSGLPNELSTLTLTSVPILPGFSVASMAIIFVAAAAISGIILRLTVFGEYVYATGGNPEAARLSGVPTKLIVVAAFGLSGLTAALGGMMITGRLGIGQPTAAQGMELDAIAAVVLGGTSLFGGRGSMLGTFFAVMLLQVLRNIFNLLGLGSFYQMVMTGVVILGAILLNRLVDRQKGRE